MIRSFFFSSRRRHTRWNCDWSSDVCSSDLILDAGICEAPARAPCVEGDRAVAPDEEEIADHRERAVLGAGGRNDEERGVREDADEGAQLRADVVEAHVVVVEPLAEEA